MRLTVWFILVYSVISTPCLAQLNLIPNPSFEEYRTCHFSWGLTPLQQILPGWSKILYTPLYGNHICHRDPTTPLSTEPYLAPSKYGDAFIMLIFRENAGVSFEPLRTYMQCRLLDTLHQNKDYYLSFFLSNYSFTNEPTVSHWGIRFSNEYIEEQNTGIQFGLLKRDAQIEFDTVPIVTNDKWDKYEYCFRADSNMTVMTVGHFRPNEETIGKDKVTESRAFLLIDNFFLAEIATEVIIEKSRDTICAGECVTLSSNHSLIPGKFNWTIEGANTEYATDSVVNVCYTEPGSYDIRLEVEHCTGKYEGIFEKSITVLPRPNYVPLVDKKLCLGDNLSLEVDSPFRWSWSDGIVGNNRVFKDAGIYYYSVDNGYCSFSDSFEISYYVIPQTINKIESTCPENSLLLGDTLIVTPGYYERTLLSREGCDSIYLQIDYRHFRPIPFEISGNKGFCQGDSTEIEIISSHDDFLWSDGDRNKIKSFSNPQFIQLEALDKNNCTTVQTFHIEEYPQPSVFTTDLIDVWYEKNMELPVQYEGNITKYLWTPSKYIDCGECPFPKLIFPYEGIFAIKISNDYGCEDQGSVKINFKSGEIYFPNIISYPSSENSIFFGKADFQGTYKISIYDRWGNKIFTNSNAKTNEPLDGWNPEGRFSQGVYVYYVEYEELGIKTSKAGDVTLINQQ